METKDINQLLAENKKLKQTVRNKNEHIKELEYTIQEQFRVIDLLQSFIPEKGNWRLFFTHSGN